ncbi:MAG: hypothetical protein UY74_C0043G0016 [Candidatus Kaiserbacteria bacterium GW2011_GWC2_52_8b]|uniref:Uncharacterized protein n=2 Tax=Candidatus Kaiseribacteriota TaxID=1752734 RepID=A0A0G1ZQ65_9BACT|nr:MAG: hypothetical protein UY67_C0035G0017 [Candidatus Kaiserbacteria bacterium GW2011_GWA2_52_12]KKW30372.1 MAG: hypothetical protein UY74_C0043G0016 [Candidatus Kaiserbacteria bacterium GW2011_GWC2_52_8b]
MKHKFQHDRGYVLLVTLVASGLILITFSTLINYVSQYAKSTRRAVSTSQTLALAEAGIDKAIYEMNASGSYNGETNTALGAGTFTTSIATIDSSTKRITSIGYFPDNVNPIITKEVKATVSINSSVVAFRFGVQVGEGGVTMDNGSQVIGNLFSNGNVSGSGTITGDATVAGGAQPSVDQEWLVQNTGFNLGDVTARADLAQAFVVSSTSALNKVSLYVKKVGLPGDITIKIVTDNINKPSKTIRASGGLLASSVTGSYGFVDASLSTSPNLTTGTRYWIIAIASINASNYFLWGEDNTDAYPNGKGMYSANWNASSPVWTNAGGDLDFRTYMGGVATSLSGITVQGNAYANTLSSCSVGGDAYYQTISNCSVGGTSHPGSVDQTAAPLVPSDGQIDDWKATAEAGGVVGSQNISDTTITLGPKKITGNLTLSNNATLTVSGTLWITGTLSASNNANIRLSPSYGSNSGVIVVDGTASLSNNATVIGSGQPGSYIMIVVAKNDPTHTVLEIGNNVGGAIFSAPHGRVEFENNAGAKEVTGYGFEMENNSTVTYESGLQNETFSNGPGGSWAFVPGSYVIAQ